MCLNRGTLGVHVRQTSEKAYFCDLLVHRHVALSRCCGSEVKRSSETAKRLWDHLWGYWRTEKSIFWYGEYPLEEMFINYPDGGTLYHVDFLNSLIMIPLRTMLGMVLAYNLLVWLHMSVAGVAMYALVRRFVSSYTAGFLAAFAFVFNPQMLVFTLASGVANRLNLVWIPLFFIAVDMWVREHKRRGIVLAPIFCFLAAIGCWHYLLHFYVDAGAFCRNHFSQPAVVGRFVVLGPKMDSDCLFVCCGIDSRELVGVAVNLFRRQWFGGTRTQYVLGWNV